MKPGNLYALEGEALVGDFGLVAAPDLEELTRTGKAIGPAHFMAYEMILDAANADPFPADVYSLAKTLWVLATHVPFPPEGHQSTSTIGGFSIISMRPHTHAGALDRLLDRMTRIQPNLRPTMEEIVQLNAWLDLGANEERLDVDSIRARLREKLQHELARADTEALWREQALDECRLLQELVRPLNEALLHAHPSAEIDYSGDQFAQNMLRTRETSGSPEILWSWLRASRISSGPDYARFSLRMGRSLELTGEGVLIFRALIDVSHERFGGSAFSWHSGGRTAPVGTLEAERMLAASVEELRGQLPAGLEAFVENLPDPSA